MTLFKEMVNRGVQHSKDHTVTVQNAEMEATMIKLVGSYITSSETGTNMKDLTSFIATHVSITEYGRLALTDALWFWGTQVRPHCASWNYFLWNLTHPTLIS